MKTGISFNDFGYGLSFTNFSYSNPTLSSAKAKAGDTVTVSVDITNTGNIDGYEIAELYYNDRFSSVLTPEKQLCGFTKLWIKAGETVRAEIPLAVDELSLIDAEGKTVLEPGVFDIMIGGSLASLQTAELIVE